MFIARGWCRPISLQREEVSGVRDSWTDGRTVTEGLTIRATRLVVPPSLPPAVNYIRVCHVQPQGRDVRATVSE